MWPDWTALQQLLDQGFLRRLRLTLQKWREDDGSLMAAAVAYYAAVSFFPLLLILISGLGLALRWTDWGQDAETELLRAISEYASPAVESHIAEMLKHVQRRAVVSGPVAIGLLLLTASALFARFERAFDRIWNVSRSPRSSVRSIVAGMLLYRLRAFAMLLALGTGLLAVFLTGVVVSSIKLRADHLVPVSDKLWWTVEIGTSILLYWTLFTVLYRLVPRVPVRWSEAARGGLLAAAAWEGGRVILTTFVVGQKFSAYGVVGSFLAVMVWIYYASTVVFLGAEYVQVICSQCDDEPR